MARYTKQQVSYWLSMLKDGELDLNDDNVGLAEAAFEYLGVAQEPLAPGYITPHFTLAELCVTSTGLPNDPTPGEVDNIQRTAKVLEDIRVLLGSKPITVTSAFRSEAVNTAVGGVPNSAHRLGLAADFVCPGFGTPQYIARYLKSFIDKLDLDQLIYENKGGAQWVHIGLSTSAPRHQALTIDDSGTYTGIA